MKNQSLNQLAELAYKTLEEYILYNHIAFIRAGLVICDEEHFKGFKIDPSLMEESQGLYVEIIFKNKSIMYGHTLNRHYSIAQETIELVSQGFILAQEKDADLTLKDLSIKIHVLKKNTQMECNQEKFSQVFNSIKENNKNTNLCVKCTRQTQSSIYFIQETDALENNCNFVKKLAQETNLLNDETALFEIFSYETIEI